MIAAIELDRLLLALRRLIAPVGLLGGLDPAGVAALAEGEGPVETDGDVAGQSVSDGLVGDLGALGVAVLVVLLRPTGLQRLSGDIEN